MAKNTEYKLLQGIDYPPKMRAEAGDIVSDLPKDSIVWLLASGAITADLTTEVGTAVVTEPQITEQITESVPTEPTPDELPITEEETTNGI